MVICHQFVAVFIHNLYIHKVVETWWAIGTSPGDSDVQPFVNIGTQSSVSNTSLEGLLLDNHTYYVTLKCINGAGLMTVNSSQGEVNYYSSLPSNGGKLDMAT